MDYGKYLEDQKGWPKILAEKAELDNGATDREYAMLAIMAIKRLLALSLQPSFQIDKDSGQDLPCVDAESDIRAARSFFCIFCDACHFAVGPMPLC